MADAGSGLGDHPKLNLTAEEKRIFGALFKQADTKDGGVVTGEVAIALFPRAKLPEEILGQIWAMADTENRGFLTPEDFAKALRLVAHHQSRPERPLTEALFLEPSPPGFPKFDGLNVGLSSKPGDGPGIPPPSIQVQNSGSIRVPPLTPDKHFGYTKMFEQAGAKDGILAGNVARGFFERSGLPLETLGHVWNLADTQQRSALSLPEFIVAMHLLASLRDRTLTALPQSLPAGLIEAASRKLPNQPPITSALPRQFSGAGAGRTSSPLSRQPMQQPFGSPKPPQGDWLVPAQDLPDYYRIFERLDAEKGSRGYIDPDQALVFFSQSHLDNDTLAIIWDLATVRKLDQLNREEFAVAMFLIRSQRLEDKPVLPKALPPNLVPPTLRQAIAQAPTSAPAPAPAPSATEDLFGLDAFSAPSAAPAPVPQQNTGGSAPFSADPFGKPRSPIASSFSQPSGESSTFKRFVPTSSWGQTLNTQNTGGSGTSSTVQSRDVRPSNSAMDDLLGDNDPEISKKLTPETSELANMSNQMKGLQTQMAEVQGKKNVTEADLQTTNTQRRDLEIRLNQFRSRYEQEFKAVKALEDQLATSRKETRRLQAEMSELEGDYNNLQGQQRQLAGALENERRENASLKDRMRQINAEMTQLRPLLEKLRSDGRHEKGMVSINKKQLEKSETERDAAKSEVADLTKTAQDAARSPPAEPSSYAASPAGSTQSTNPFFRKSPQQSFDNTMSPGGFAQPQSKDGNKFDNFFGPSYNSYSSSSGPAPPVSFQNNSTFPPPSEESVTSSDTNNFPTPSASPRPFETAVPPLGQFTSKDLGTPAASTATSVRVETPSSRYDGGDTPTNVGGASPQAQGFRRPEHTRTDTQTSTGAAMFDRNANTSPVASTTSDASSRPKQAGFFGGGIPGAFPENTTPLQPDLTGTSGFSSGSKQSGPRSDPFSFPGQPSRTATNKSDFDQAFATVGSSSAPQARQVTGSSTNGSLNEPSASKFKSEFPPIELKEEDSDTDSEPGFDDDFTQASPGHNRKTSQNQFNETRSSKDTPSNSFFTTQPSTSELPTPGAQKSPPTYDQSGVGSTGARGSNDFPPEFGGLLPSRENPMSNQSQTSQSPERSFASPASGTQGHALFGGPSTSKSASTAPTTAFSGSPPPATSTPVSTVPSDAYHTAGSYPSGSTDKSSSNQPTTSNRNSQPAGDDFDSGFDDLTEAKEDDVRDDDDFMFGSQHNESFDEFNPAFDSPAMSKSGTMASERTPTTSGHATTFGDSSFGDFESNFSSKPSQSASASASKPAGQDDWETMMQSISGPSGGGSKGAAGIGFGDGPDLGFSGLAAPMPPPAVPEAPSPPKLGRSITQASEHDVGFVKDLMGMGYARPVVVAALEKYDYDFDKALESLSK